LISGVELIAQRHAGPFVAGDGFAVVGAVPVPYLSAGVAGVGEDFRDGA
jgi:hypothetical protein